MKGYVSGGAPPLSAVWVPKQMTAKTSARAPRLGSLAYAAAQIGISLPTLYKLIDGGKLRTFHVGRAHRVSQEAIMDCIALLESENARTAANRSFAPDAPSLQTRR
jgi:excisionase family DNA binding protein